MLGIQGGAEKVVSWSDSSGLRPMMNLYFLVIRWKTAGSDGFCVPAAGQSERRTSGNKQSLPWSRRGRLHSGQVLSRARGEAAKAARNGIERKSLLRVLLIAFSLVLFTQAQVPTTSHVVIVLEENSNYSNVVGSSSMPYLNSLINKYGLATQYYANTHPSIGNYFMLTTGQILTNDDSQTPSSFPVSVDNVVRELLTAGKTWKGYGEGLPSVGYTGGDWSFNGCTGYVRHFPLAYLTDVQNSAAQKLNLVPFTQFATDLANETLPNYSFVTPDGCNDLHDGSAAQADSWLQTNIAPLLTNSQFMTDGLLIIVFDESGSDNTNGGGRVEWMIAGPKVKPAYQSTTLYQHQSSLRMILETQGITSEFAGAAASAPDMAEFFGTSVASVSVSISPTSASVLSGGTQQFTATVSNTNNTAVTWSATAGSISASGLYTALAVTTNSSATVTATSVTDPSKSASAIVSIMGTPDFSVSASPLTPGTVSPGASSTATVNVATAGGFSSAVALSCSVQPLPSLAPKCSISPSSTTAGTAAILTVSTTGPTAGALPSSAGSALFYALWLSLLGLVVAGVNFGSERTRKGEAVILAWVLLTGLVFEVACGGGSTSSSGGGSNGTPVGTYTITVTGTSGSIQHSITTMLTVQLG
jgi:phosphatidylinositol-3-phosphatase